jgi:hypothetical protein
VSAVTPPAWYWPKMNSSSLSFGMLSAFAYGAEYEGCALDLAHAKSQSKLHLLELVTSQHSDSSRQQFDITSAALCLWWLEAQPYFGFLEAALYAQRLSI